MAPKLFSKNKVAKSAKGLLGVPVVPDISIKVLMLGCMVSSVTVHAHLLRVVS